MTQDIILWGIPGYLSFLLFQLARPTRNKSGWDFVAQTAVFALLNFFLARLFFILGILFLPSIANPLLATWTAMFSQGDTFSLGLGVVIAPFTGILLGKLWNKSHPLIARIAHWLSGRRRTLEFTDTFFATCNSLLSKMVLLTLNSGKVYVGVLLEATDDPNETQRFIKMAPVMSGHRKKDDSKVVFDTDYMGTIESLGDIRNRDLLISMNQVSTLARFDNDLHEWFVKTGRTEIQRQEPPESQS